MTPRIEAWREELKGKIIDSPRHWRILFLGRSVNGTTDIVSCLYRALRNLGHKVLVIDTKRHNKITSNPDRHQGGNGPIHIDLKSLRPAIERFKPQMVICIGGGLAFDDEDSEALKAMGPMLLGVTLSDPDVFPTVSRYADRFDLHTTNATVAMDMYKKANIDNTLYFPFAIDRGYVTQIVPPAPELKADIICLGHATARPERNDVMTRIAEKFQGVHSVRTYGRGWTLPKSEVVEGTRMIQASRNGRLHVNFAATRAGYINVKVGAFETIGSGALLATSRFPEMEHFFAYDDEILGFDDIDDLESQIGEIMGDDRRYEGMVERAFQRLITEHLYEHRWLDLFRQIETVLAQPPAWLDAGRAADMARALESTAPRAKRVILSGFYGAHNVGDEMILRSIAERLEAADPATDVVVGAENPQAVEIAHGLNAFKRADHLASDDASRTASAIVVGGGGLWHDYTFTRSGGIRGLFTGARISIGGFGILPEMGRVRGIPFHVMGLGVGPLTDPDAKLAVRHLGGLADTITVRDSESLELLQGILAEPGKAIHAPDVVYALDLSAAKPFDAKFAAGRKIIGLNLRFWSRDTGETLPQRIAEALDLIAEDEEIAVLGLPMQQGVSHDQGALNAVFDAMKSTAPRRMLEDAHDLGTLLGALKACDVLLAMRLHACLLAHRLGTPTVGLAYDPKVARHFDEVGRGDRAVPITVSASEIAELVLDELEDIGRAAVMTQVARHARDLEARSIARLDAVARLVADAPNRQAVHEVPPPAAEHERPAEKVQPEEEAVDIVAESAFAAWPGVLLPPRGVAGYGDLLDRRPGDRPTGRPSFPMATDLHIERRQLLNPDFADRGRTRGPGALLGRANRGLDENEDRTAPRFQGRAGGDDDLREFRDFDRDDRGSDTPRFGSSGGDGRRNFERNDRGSDAPRFDRGAGGGEDDDYRPEIRNFRRDGEQTDTPRYLGQREDEYDLRDGRTADGDDDHGIALPRLAGDGGYAGDDRAFDALVTGTGWQLVPLTNVEGSGGNLGGNGNVEALWGAARQSAFVAFASDAPSRNDYAAIDIDLPAPGDSGCEVRLEIVSRYCRPQNRGWVQYEILVDGKVELSEDIGLRREANVVTLLFPRDGEKHRLTVRVRALRNCLNWHWSGPSRVLIRNLAVRQVEWKGRMRAAASSPASMTRSEITSPAGRLRSLYPQLLRR